MRNFILTVIMAGATLVVSGQVSDTSAQELKNVREDVDELKKVKISGYMQPQFQVADTAGISTFAGGSFEEGVDNRFMLRRARVKASYAGDHTNFVFQVDVTEKGAAIKDVYARISEPWLDAVSLTMGMMSRPFGFEVGYSSSRRESPERGRMSQTIFSGERDLGALLTIQPPETCMLHFVKLEAGLFNGNGAPSALKSNTDWDNRKDFIGRLSMKKKLLGDKGNLGLGASYYNGGLQQSNKFVYAVGNAGGMPAMVVDSAAGNLLAIGSREYVGGDAQLDLSTPAGDLTLRGEFIAGTQPGTSSSSTSPKSDPISDYSADLNANRQLDTYRRKFNGAYFYLVWTIMESKHQLVAKYDWYDPNTDVAGDDIDPAGMLSSADIKYNTLGLGWSYLWDRNVKIVAYYDLVTNETSANLPGFTEDRKDNVFTLRMQYKF